MPSAHRWGFVGQCAKQPALFVYVQREIWGSTLHRAPVGQGPSGPDWLAIAFGFWSGRALATGTAWAGLCLIHHHHHHHHHQGKFGVRSPNSAFAVLQRPTIERSVDGSWRVLFMCWWSTPTHAQVDQSVKLRIGFFYVHEHRRWPSGVWCVHEQRPTGEIRLPDRPTERPDYAQLPRARPTTA